jgi:hypothetical protein
MNEKPLMKKQSIKNLLIFAAILGCVSLFLPSCQSPETNKWTPPKFVKEWEIKEIKPGLPHEIISMTANNDGLFVLVKLQEIKYLPPEDVKNATEMTEKEKDDFLLRYIMGRAFSGEAVTSMTKEEKNEVIDFFVKHLIPPQKASELKEYEKEKIVNFFLKFKEKEPEVNKKLFREWLEKEGRDKVIDSIVQKISTAVSKEINHFQIQHYDFNGDLIKQYPEEGVLKDPIKILSDSLGNIYTADYKANQLIKFDRNGLLEKKWKMLPAEPIGAGDIFRGVAVAPKARILTIGEGDVIMTPGLYEYDTNWKLIKRQGLESRIKAYLKLFKNALIPSLMKVERIGDMTTDTTGNLYLLKYKNITEGPVIVKLTPSWKEEREFEVILKEGFEAPKIPEFEKRMPGFKGIKQFDTTQMSWMETEPGFYFPSKLFFDGKYLYVTFLGSKPFGVIDAVIYDQKGMMVGYWKERNRSYMDWYKSLSLDIEVIDIALSEAGYGSSIFLGRTMEIKTGAFYSKNIIQKFNK